MNRCPKCGSQQIIHEGNDQYRCQKCGYVEISIKLAGLSVVEKEVFEIPFDPNTDFTAKTVKGKNTEGKIRVTMIKKKSEDTA